MPVRKVMSSVVLWSAVLSTSCGGEIPADRLVDWRRAGTAEFTQMATIELDAKALAANPDEILRKTIYNAAQGTVVLLPAGEYKLSKSIRMRSGVVLRGVGAGKTVLKFRLPKKKSGAVSFRGRLVSSIPVDGSLSAGDREIKLTGGGAFKPGWLADVSMENDPILMYTNPKWDVAWAARARGQVTEIAASTAGSIVLKSPLLLDYPGEWKPAVSVYEPLTRAGIEDLTIELIDGDGCYNVLFDKASNCRVAGIESRNCSSAHIWIRKSSHIEVSKAKFSDAKSYGGGGNGYGVAVAERSSSCLVINNIFHHLRHSMMVKQGANANVFAYNHSYGNTKLCDISLHGHYPYANLFEGNVAEFIEAADYWGPCGPLNTFFRNRLTGKGVKAKDHSKFLNVIGNNIVKGVIDIAPSCSDALIIDNLIAGRVLNGGSANSLPNSLFLSGPPAFWGNYAWPAVGAGSAGSEIPAQNR